MLSFLCNIRKSRNPSLQSRIPAPHYTAADSRMTFFMITLFELNCNPIIENIQKKYDDFICALQIHQLTCSCQHSACLSIHAYYFRSIKLPCGHFRIRICRVRCSFCGRTHALMPAFIVPYSQTALPGQVEIIRHLRDGKHDLSGLMQRCPSIDENNIKTVIRNYMLHWKQRLLSFSIPLEPVKDLITGCFRHHKYQFMQIKKTVNVLFVQTT